MHAAATTQTAEMPDPSSQPPPRLPDPGQRGDQPRAILACLASGQWPRAETGRAVGCRPSSLDKGLARLKHAGAVVAIGGSRCQAVDVAAHIGRPVSTATAHLAAMRRRGLVLRITSGRYERADPIPCRAAAVAAGGPATACAGSVLPRCAV